ncbi:MAG: dockerin type I domain-containing protein, partial [Candidatus Ornithomonoglobus sp.]
AFNELYNEVPYTSNSGETIYGLKDLTDIVENNPDMLRYMTQTARYQVCMNQIYNADIDDYVSAVKAIPEITYANYNTEEISDAIDKAQAAYDKMGVDGLFAGKQLSESRVAYYKNIFDDIVNARNVLINAEEASAEYILRIKEIVNTVNGMIEDVEAYESDYDNVKADIAELAADLDALAGENYSAYAYIKNNVQENYIESFENASNAFVSAFKFIGVKREIAEVYDAYQRNESGLTIRINDCEESYNNLSDDQKKLVTNYSYLVYMKTNNEDDIVAGVVNKIGSLAENYTLSEMSIGDFAKDENGEYVLAELLSTIEEIRAELNLLSNDKAAECEDKISQAGYDGLIDAWAIIADAVKAKEDGTLKLGDVNGDGSVNITDIVKMVDRLNEKPLVSGDSESLEYYAANIAAEFKMDVNGNGSIDLNDIVVTIRNLIEF